jgi:2-keto-4-pentenoate hydratase
MSLPMTQSTFDPTAAAHFLRDAHATRAVYANLPEAIAPRTIAEAYLAQDALRETWLPARGPIAGYKIATTTKVMQALMGIDHPCQGNIFGKTVHASPARLPLSNFMNLVIECELCVRLGQTLAATTAYTAEAVAGAVKSVMPAFELIEDRRANYKETKVHTLIADNAWNAGVVLGTEVAMTPGLQLDGVQGRLVAGGKEAGAGKTDGPLGALAWVANLAVSRGRPLQAGQIVMTGSVMPTLAIMTGQTFVFTLDGIGTVTMAAV